MLVLEMLHELPSGAKPDGARKAIIYSNHRVSDEGFYKRFKVAVIKIVK